MFKKQYDIPTVSYSRFHYMIPCSNLIPKKLLAAAFFQLYFFFMSSQIRSSSRPSRCGRFFLKKAWYSPNKKFVKAHSDMVMYPPPLATSLVHSSSVSSEVDTADASEIRLTTRDGTKKPWYMGETPVTTNLNWFARFLPSTQCNQKSLCFL